MEALLARYLDGELTEAEAAKLLERAETDPRWARALAGYEAMLLAARRLPVAPPPADFTQRVMEQVMRAAGEPTAAEAHASARRRSAVHAAARRRAPAWLSPRALLVRGSRGVPLAAAAVLVLAVFAAGILAGRTTRPSPSGRGVAGEGAGGADAPAGFTSAHTLLGGTPWIAAPAGSQLRVVRLVYVPQRGDVTRVTVAGSFNNWDPDGLPMQRAGDVFTALLSLPPGAYEYMFVEDGQRWVTDPLALQTRADGFGNANAVLDLTL